MALLNFCVYRVDYFHTTIVYVSMICKFDTSNQVVSATREWLGISISKTDTTRKQHEDYFGTMFHLCPPDTLQFVVQGFHDVVLRNLQGTVQVAL